MQIQEDKMECFLSNVGVSCDSLNMYILFGIPVEIKILFDKI